MTTWLEDASANRHIKTYVKDFLDLSGNFTVRNNEDYKWNSYGQVLSGPYESDDAVWFGIGMGMDVSGLTIVVGANKQNGNNISDGGAVYVYRYDTTAEIWYQLGNLIEGESNNDDFGLNVDINDAGTRIMATDPTANFVNVYDYNSGTNTWDKQVNLTTSDGIVAVDPYAGRISGDGNTIVFGAYVNSGWVGKQYVFRNTSGTTWTKIGDFTGSHSATYLGLSPSITYDGNRITVIEREHNYDEDGNIVKDSGRAAIFDYSGSGTTWNQVGDWLYGNIGYEEFGASADLSKDGSIVAFSAYYGNYVKVYQYDAAVTGSWRQLGSTITSDVERFGTGLRLSDDGTTLLISTPYDDTAGTNNGAMYIYKYIGYDWVQQGSTLYGAYTGAQLGYEGNIGASISGDGSKIVAGGLVADVNGTDSGYVQAFQWSREPMDHPIMEVSGNTFTIDCNSKNHASSYTVAQLGSTLYGEAANDHFGIVAEMNKDGSVVAIGAKGVSSDDGAVYVYTYRSGAWQQKGSTISPYSSSSFSTSQFGYGIDINDDGNVIVVGAAHNYNDNGASVNDAGALDVFEFTNGDWVQKGRSFKGIAVDDFLGLFSSSINGAGNIIAGLFHMSGFVRVYQYDDDTSDWVQMGGDIPMTPGTTTVAEYYQTRRIDLSEDGTIIALGDVQDDTAGTNDGKITIYKYTVVDNVGSWNKLGDDIVSPNGATDSTETFGLAVSLSSDGHTVAFSSLNWNGQYGLARIFKYSEEGNVWTQLGADFNATTVANYGGATLAFRAIALSGDGKTFMHGDGHNDGGVSNGGAVHMYKYLNGQWNHFHTEYGTISNGYFGLTGVGMSRDGTRFVASTGAADYPGTDQGYSRMFEITHTPVLKIANGEVTFGSFSGYSLSYGDLKSTFNDDAFTTTGNVGIGTSSSETIPLDIWGYNPSHNTTIYPVNMTSMTQSSSGIQAGLGVGISFHSERRNTDDMHGHGYLYSYAANTNNQWNLGLQSRNNDTFLEHLTLRYDGNVGFRVTNPSYTVETTGTAVATSGWTVSSDDRLKVNEQKIEGALTTLQKLVPQTYTKYEKFDISGNKTITDLSSDSIFEAGLIAQEIYYNAPELRNLISIGSDASSNNFHPQEYDLSGNDIQQDPDYTALGWTEKSAGVNYMELVPYLIKAIQEQQEMIVEQESQIQSLVVDLAALKNK